MSLNGINAGYAATAATAIEKVQKADKATASSKESAYKSEAGATYETTVSASSKQTKNAALVAQLKLIQKNVLHRCSPLLHRCLKTGYCYRYSR